MKHTPGPWAVVEREPFNPHPNILNPNFARFWIGTAATEWRGPSEVATVSGNKDDEIPGNARLIAAAPELLESARFAIWSIVGILSDDSSASKEARESLADVQAQLEIAIAKAEGKE